MFIEIDIEISFINLNEEFDDNFFFIIIVINNGDKLTNFYDDRK